MEKVFVKNESRPTNVGILNLLIFKWPLPSLISITHRIAGVALFAGMAIILYGLDVSLSSEEGFKSIVMMMTSPFGKFVTWALLAALAYHFVAGVKHLLMDLGVGETLEGAVFAARVVILLSAVIIFLAGIWVFQP